MNERIVVLDINDGEAGGSLGDNFRYFTIPCDLDVIFVSASPSVNDADATIDINDDGTEVITAISCAVAATPGTWKSTHMGGTNAPVHLAAGSVISLDANSLDGDTRVFIQIYALVGELFS